MSLDVYLIQEASPKCEYCGRQDEEVGLYSDNITHNLGDMAKAAGIYEALWRPYKLKPDYIPNDDYEKEYEYEKQQLIRAKELIKPLTKGLKLLKKKPSYFSKYNSSTGWGLYEHFVPFVEQYLNACKKYPEALVTVSR